jgi:hypothetical protein
MHTIARAKIRSNVKFGHDDDDDDDDDDDAFGGSCCDYVVALETDNTLEIIRSEDGQLVNVMAPFKVSVCCCCCCSCCAHVYRTYNSPPTTHYS